MILPSLSQALQKLGIENTTVCLHTAMRAFSPRITTQDLVDTLLSTGTTLLAPAFTYHFEVAPPPGERPRQNGMSYDKQVIRSNTNGVFRPDENSLSTTDMGSLPLTLLETPGRARGSHPLNSFVAVGQDAGLLVSQQTSEDVYAPFRLLIDRGGKILLIGTDATSLTLVHYAEMLAGRQLFIRWARDPDGMVIRTRVGGCSSGFGALMPALLANAQTMIWHGARFIAADAGELVAVLQQTIVNDPAMTHCRRDSCQRCADALQGGPQS